MEVEAAFADRLFHVGAHLLDEHVHVELHVLQRFFHRVALDERLEDHFAVFGQGHVYGVGVAEQVVHVSQDFLVGAQEKRAEVIRLAVELMQRQRPLHVAAVDELVDLAVGVAGDVAEHGVRGRLFAQAMDGHHGEELLDGPTVGHRLEEREVAEVGVAQERVEPLQIFRHEFKLLRQPLNLAADRPEQVLGQAALVDRQIARAEQAHRQVEGLLRVVIGFEHVPHREIAVRVVQVDDRLLGLRGQFRGNLRFAEA